MSDILQQGAKIAHPPAFSPVCVHCPEMDPEDSCFGAGQNYFQKSASCKRDLMPLIVADINSTYERNGLTFASCPNGHHSLLRQTLDNSRLGSFLKNY
jgi:hypothetical protein